MQKELEDLQPQLVIAAEENEKMMIVIQKESKEVEVTTEKARIDKFRYNDVWYLSEASSK